MSAIARLVLLGTRTYFLTFLCDDDKAENELPQLWIVLKRLCTCTGISSPKVTVGERTGTRLWSYGINSVDQQESGRGLGLGTGSTD